MQRLIAPVLAVVAIASTAIALRQPGAPRPTPAGLPAPAAPLLSLRRAPELLARTVAEYRLRTQLDAAVAAPAVASSCLIVRQGTRELYSRNPDRPLIPASNLKILTAIAVLTKIDPEERLITSAKAATPIRPDGTLAGPLHLVGGGDPLLMTADYAATLKNQPPMRTPFEQLADQLVASGLKHVQGPILGDESRYDAVRYIPSWRPNYAADGEVGPASALLVNDGFAEFHPRRIAAGRPAAHAAALLSDLLRGRGVLIDGPPGQGDVPASAATISELRSPPFRDVVAQMLKESDNTTAELLAKELGRRQSGNGSTAAGIKAMQEVLAARGLSTNDLRAVDGSGLDRSDQATCDLLSDSLGTGDPLPLPIAGKEGTLADRFIGHPAAGRLKAKTGSLNGVVGLSGYLDTLSFSLLANDLPRDAIGRALQESVGAALARYPDAPAPDDLDP